MFEIIILMTLLSRVLKLKSVFTDKFLQISCKHCIDSLKYEIRTKIMESNHPRRLTNTIAIQIVVIIDQARQLS
jgi:hypothetical protein